MNKLQTLTLLSFIFFYACKTNNKENPQTPNTKIVSKYISLKLTECDNVLKKIKAINTIKNTKNKYTDWTFDNNTFLESDLFEIKKSDFSVKSNSYTYKDSVVFFIHKLQHTNDSLFLRDYTKNIAGKSTESKMSERVTLYFLDNSTNDKEVISVDIPPNWNHLSLKTQLINDLYKEFDCIIIACDTIQVCKYKDLRE